MSVFDTFKKREQRKRGEMPDVYTYDKLSPQLRVQIIHLIKEGIGDDIADGISSRIYTEISRIMHNELGVFELNKYACFGPLEEIKTFIVEEQDVEWCLSMVEISLRCIDNIIRKDWYVFSNKAVGILKKPDDVINCLNIRFREAGVGYQYVSGQIIRVDSEILHSEAVKPVLNLLRDQRYRGANEEFLSAYAHYRNGRHKECLTDCAKAFESTMKIICNKRDWAYAAGDTANKLVNIILGNSLIAKYWQTHFTSLSSMLSSGIPTPRNKTSAHGQGGDVKEVPDYLASYILHQTAATILMLIEADKSLP